MYVKTRPQHAQYTHHSAHHTTQYTAYSIQYSIQYSIYSIQGTHSSLLYGCTYHNPSSRYRASQRVPGEYEGKTDTRGTLAAASKAGGGEDSLEDPPSPPSPPSPTSHDLPFSPFSPFLSASSTTFATRRRRTVRTTAVGPQCRTWSR